MDIKIYKEEQEDYTTVEEVIKKAFKNAEHTDHCEHNLVSTLRKSPEFVPELSLVAKDKNLIVGHILFTKILIKNHDCEHEALALAPLSVLPSHQNKGIGSKLINEGNKIAKELGFKAVIVLGHEKYYPKFGFKKASNYNIKAPFEVPDNAFMALELTANGLSGVSDTAIYPKAFFEI